MKNFLKHVISCIAAVAVLLYVGLQVSLSVGDMIEVETAVFGSTDRAVTANAYIFRDETPVTVAGGGTPCYFYSDGEKIARGAELLTVYRDPGDAALQEEINELEKKISVLERSSIIKVYSTNDLETLDRSISERVYSIIANVNSGELRYASLGEDDLLILLNRRTAVMTAAGGYEMIIDEYRDQIETLKARLTETPLTVRSAESGYFYSATDGYEYTFTVSALENMTLEQYDGLASAEPRFPLNSLSTGKIVSSPRWYITVSLDKKTLSRLTSGKSSSAFYSVRFPYSGGVTLEMKLDRVISQTNYDTAVAVFCSDTLKQGFNYTRNQPVEIIAQSYSGLKIPASAVRVVDGKVGVYTLDGTVVKFKTTEILYEENGYCYCKQPYADRIDHLSKTKLSLYDPVIVSGRDLYEGKIVK